VLALLFGQPSAATRHRDHGLAGAGSGAAQRELARLSQSGLITAQSVGIKRHIKPTAASAGLAELSAMV